MDIKLVIFDLDGVFFDRVKLKDLDQSDLDQNELDDRKYYDYVWMRYYIKTGLYKFIYECSKKYDIAIYTSITNNNVHNILKKIFGVQYKKKFKFILAREYVKFDPDYGDDPDTENYDTVKYLDDIFMSPIYSKNRTYNKDNTVIVDDSYKKIRFNDPKNVILFDPQESEHNDEYNICQSYNDLYEILKI